MDKLIRRFGMRKTISLFLVFSILTLSGNMFAKERKGAGVIISTKDGRDVRGELIAIKESSLLLMEKDSGADVTADISDIKVVRITKKSKAGLGFLTCGAIGALLGSLSYNASDDWMSLGRGGQAALTGLFGGLIGLIGGGLAGIDKKIKIEKKSDSEIQEILEKLRKKARVPDYK
jgi:hypothetical protein